MDQLKYSKHFCRGSMEWFGKPEQQISIMQKEQTENVVIWGTQKISLQKHTLAENQSVLSTTTHTTEQRRRKLTAI